MVTLTPTEHERLRHAGGGLLERLRAQLPLAQELILGPLIDEHRAQRGEGAVLAQELRRVVGCAVGDGTEIRTECLLSPIALGRVADGRKRAHRGPPLWVLERDRQCAMASHRMAGDGTELW